MNVAMSLLGRISGKRYPMNFANDMDFQNRNVRSSKNPMIGMSVSIPVYDSIQKRKTQLWYTEAGEQRKGKKPMYKERIGNLMKEAVRREPDMSINDPDSLASFIEERVNKFVDYTTHVTKMELHMQLLNAKGIKGEEWRDIVENMDRNRRSKHENAMDAVNQLNRMSASYGLEPFYEGPVDDEHRYEIGDLCRDICTEYFDQRFPQPLKASEILAEEEQGRAKDFASSVEQLSEEINTEIVK